MIKEGTVREKNYLNIFDFSQVVEVSGQKTLSRSMIIASLHILRTVFLKCFMYIYVSQGNKRGNLQMHAKCVLKCNKTYMRSFKRISYLNVLC